MQSAADAERDRVSKLDDLMSGVTDKLDKSSLSDLDYAVKQISIWEAETIAAARALGATADQIGQIETAADLWRDSVTDASDATADAAAQLDALASGLRSLSTTVTTSLRKYGSSPTLQHLHDQVYAGGLPEAVDAEDYDAIQGRIDLGREYHDLVVSTYDAQISAVQDLADAEQSRVESVRQAGETLLEWIDEIRLDDTLTTLLPGQRQSTAATSYQSVLAAAIAGDLDAQQRLAASAQDYLATSRDYYASGDQYAAIFNRVLEDLGGLGVDLAGTQYDEAVWAASIEYLQQEAVGLLSQLESGIYYLADLLPDQTDLLTDIRDDISTLPDDLARAVSNGGAGLRSLSNGEIAGFLEALWYDGVGRGRLSEESATALTQQWATLYGITSQQVADVFNLELWQILDALDRYGLPAFAEGGITSGPSLAGEAGPEAVVPLPDGRTIPVRITGGQDELRELREEVRTLREQLAAQHDASQQQRAAAARAQVSATQQAAERRAYRATTEGVA